MQLQAWPVLLIASAKGVIVPVATYSHSKKSIKTGMNGLEKMKTEQTRMIRLD